MNPLTENCDLLCIFCLSTPTEDPGSSNSDRDRTSRCRSLPWRRFDSEDILFGLDTAREGNPRSLHVELDSVRDMSGSFAVRSGEIVSAASVYERWHSDLTLRFRSGGARLGAQ
jgi:hypothetical protein